MASFGSSFAIEADLLTADGKTIDILKVVSKMWEQRKNIEVVNQLANLLTKFVDEKRVFKDIEFFLPQVAHLVIHLDQNSANEALEVLAMVISQTSIHAALQLSFAFSSAMEDYQPEIHTGLSNPNANPFLFARCARLLQDVERAVIYGSCLKDMIISAKAESNKSINVDDNSDDDDDDSSRIDAKKREEIAQRLSKAKSNNYEGQLTGKLFFKRTLRKSSWHSKAWKNRFFMVDQRVLYCFREPHCVNPLRAISLQNCIVSVIDKHPKYGDCCFEVVNNATSIRYQLRATDQALRQKWVDFLNKEINGAPQVHMGEDGSPSAKQASSRSEHDPAFQLGKTATPTMSIHDMTPTQRKRFAYFRQLKVFITNMTNICEGLRFKDRPLRKHFLRRDMTELVIPPFVYLPLCTSSDEFYCILRALPNECHAFTTKARVPALMLFEMEKHKVDTATFLGYELERYPESVVIDAAVEVVLKGDAADQLREEQATDHAAVTDEQNVEKKQSRFTDFAAATGTHNAWVSEGTGMERAEQAGMKLPAKLPSSVSAVDSTAPRKTVDTATEGVLGETFAGKIARIKETSPYGHLPNWTIGGLIAKSNDDVRQEVFVIQLIAYYQRAFQEANVPVWLHSYKILSTSKSTGLIELIPNATSIDGLKKREDFPGSLKAWYEQAFGGNDAANSAGHQTALDNYVASMAAYSIISYLLAIKDRHNGNIMVDKDGHIIHIDFGFVFGLAPGKAFSMEKAPWKLNKELASVMGGKSSALYGDYRKRCAQALLVARRHAREVTILMEIMQSHSNYPAFKYNPNAIKDFRSRLFLEYADQDVPKIVDRLLGQSYKHQGTDMYDSFQLATNGIAK